MKIERYSDGSIRLYESLIMLRVAGLLSACAALYLLFKLCAECDFNQIVLASAGVLALFALGAWAPETDILIDASMMRLTVTRKRLLKSASAIYPFEEIKDVVVLSVERETDRIRPVQSYRLMLMTNMGEVTLSVYSATDRQEYDSLSQEILWLVRGATPKSGDEEVNRLVSIGHVIEAVTLLRQKHGLTLEDAKSQVHEMMDKKEKM